MAKTFQLLNGEKLLWKGRQEWGPRPFLRTMIGSIGSFVAIGFSAFWIQTTRQVDADENYFMWFGLLPGAVGIHGLIKAFADTYFLRSRTEYILTNKRAIITVTAFGQRQTSILLGDVPEVRLDQHADGTATILFGRDQTQGKGEDAHTSYAFRFRFVRDATRVVDAFEKLRKYKYQGFTDASSTAAATADPSS
ncbi:hypothetical protein [Dongia sp.]|jgi:hypothetical protein|uniref:hypothetical protein n=1 Tax=Dongia sp. TaxID=1977262 RepID=UPI0034A201CD